MNTLVLIILSTFIISLGALVGVLFLALQEKKLTQTLMFLVSLSAGALMGGAFIHLLPEAVEELESSNVFLITLAAFCIFFLIEKILHWRHCHKGECNIHTFGYMNLFGDSIHNFIDGLIIAATFLTNSELGFATVFAVALHEIPQEMGDFGVLIHAGFKKGKALIINFLVALTVVFGGVVGYFLSFRVEQIIPNLLPFAAGGFIYIAASDLMPEIRKETSLKKSILLLSVFLLGILIMFLVKFIGHE